MSDDASDKGLEGLLSECGVSPALTTSLVMAGWSLETFAACSDSISGFEAIWTELLPDYPDITLLEKSAIKAAWRRLQQTPAPVAQQSSAHQAVASEGTWNELHAPKLSASVLADLKRAFFRDFPSEVLSPDTCPSSRLLALTHSQVQKQDIHWVPWKYRMSQQRMEDIQMARPPKLAKTESSSLHQLLWDEPPSIEVGNQNMGLNGIRNMLELVNTSYALVQAAHMGRLRAYSVKFMSLISSRLDNDLGLRHVTALEAQAADRHLWGIMHDLMVDKGWTLNDSLHEITAVRADMMSLLQPRPRATSARPSTGDSQLTTPRNKGKGKSKGKTKSPVSIGSPKWVSEITIDGSKHSICMRFQQGKCNNPNGRFKHVCAHPKMDGSACGGQHSAKDHHQTPH